MGELHEYLTEMEMERLMAAPRRDRDLTKPRPGSKRVSRESLLAQMRGAPPPTASIEDASESEPAPPADPASMSDREFLIFVSDEAKSDVLTNDSKLLRAPGLEERWYWALGQLLAWVTKEFVRRGGRGNNVGPEYYRWKQSAMAYKHALETRRGEIKPAVLRIARQRHQTKEEGDRGDHRKMLVEVSAWLGERGEEALKNRIDALLYRDAGSERGGRSHDG